MSIVEKNVPAQARFTVARLDRLAELGREAHWRHDVDYYLLPAARMAGAMQVCGIRSTFYLRLPERYEVEPHELVALADVIRGRGHRIGAHVDLDLPRDAVVTNLQMWKAAAETIAKLRGIGVPVGPWVSFHAPPDDILWRDMPVLRHAMGRKVCGRYISDSRGVFRVAPEEALLTWGREAHINLHPEWWWLPEDDANALRAQEAMKP